MVDVPELLLKINHVQDPSAPTDLEKKHLAVLDAPESVKAGEQFEVKVHVGKLLEHPNEPDHHIEEISLYKGYIFLGSAVLTAVFGDPIVTFRVKLVPNIDDSEGLLRVFIRCNKHGVWENTKTIQVQ